MTTIAYRDGVMAADSATTSANVIVISKLPKIIANGNGDLASACGPAGFCDRFMMWFELGEHGETPKFEEGSGIIVRSENGQIEVYDSSGVSYMRPSYIAIGSGAPMAMGAMWAGADARGAIKCGIALDPYTRGPVVALKLGKKNGNKR